MKLPPWGDFPVFYWDEHNLKKISHHGLKDYEIEECFEGTYIIAPHKKAKSSPEKYGDRYAVKGVTEAGRRVIVIVQYLGANWVRPITAWDQE